MKALCRREWLLYWENWLPVSFCLILLYIVMIASAVTTVDPEPVLIGLSGLGALFLHKEAGSGQWERLYLEYRHRDIVCVKYITVLGSSLLSVLTAWMLGQDLQAALSCGMPVLALSSAALALAFRRPYSRVWTMGCAINAWCLSTVLMLRPSAAVLTLQLRKYISNTAYTAPDPVYWILLPAAAAVICFALTLFLPSHRP